MNNQSEILSDKQITDLSNFLKRINYSKADLLNDTKKKVFKGLDISTTSKKSMEDLIRQINQNFDIEKIISIISADMYEKYEKTISQGQAESLLRRILGLSLSSTARSQLYELRKKIQKYERFNAYFGEFGKIHDYALKILILGLEEEQASKLNSFLDRAKISPGKKIIGVDFYTKLIENYDKSLVNLQIWDISKYEKFKSIRNQYYRGAIAAIFTFDKTNRESFDSIRKYYSELKEKTNLKFSIKRMKKQEFEMPIALVGLGGDSIIPYDDIYNLAKEFNAQYYEITDIDDDPFQEMLTVLTYQVSTRIQQE